MLTIVISTMGSRIDNICLPKPNPSIHYLIVCQQDSETDFVDSVNNHLRDRSDLKILFSNTRGLSVSRNIGIKNVQNEYMYIADDDIVIDTKELLRGLEIIINQAIDVGTVMHAYSKSGFAKKYPRIIKKHNYRSIGSVSSIDLIIKTKSIVENKIQFNENFGLGTTRPSGEEYLFLADCLNKKLQVVFLPVLVSTHPEITSGQDFYSTVSKIKAKKEIIEIVFKRWSWLVRAIFWIKKLPIAMRGGNGWSFTYYLLLHRDNN
jgi:glycosyltransferase involved in cell wall biosynthesis